METITGFVEHIVYRNEENGYTVLNLASNEEDEITCVGVFQMISEGESLELTGEYTVHPSYGPQFKVQQYSIKAPEDIASIERYLGSGAIKGVGAALAARIVRKFKEDTFRIIEEEPERLAEIKGISERKAQEIAQQTEEKRNGACVLPIAGDDACQWYAGAGHVYRAEACIDEEGARKLVEQHEGLVKEHKAEKITSDAP